MRKLTFWLGAWKMTATLRWSFRRFSIGASCDVHSIRNLYPWLSGGIYLGPVSFELDAVRPDDVSVPFYKGEQPWIL
jgi:hypothetical protein